MTTRILLNASDRESYFALVRTYKFPCTVNVAKGKNRSVEQNKLQRKWLKEAAEQLGENQTAEELRGYCKLHFGVPIMREESEDFCELYDRIVKPHSYEDKLALMMVPLDLPVTRLMTTKQKSMYLDAVHAHFAGLGVLLSNPEGRVHGKDEIAA